MPETEASWTPKLHFSKLSPPQQPLHTPKNQTTVVPKPIPHSIHLSSLTTKIIQAHDHFHTKKNTKTQFRLAGSAIFNKLYQFQYPYQNQSLQDQVNSTQHRVFVVHWIMIAKTNLQLFKQLYQSKCRASTFITKYKNKNTKNITNLWLSHNAVQHETLDFPRPAKKIQTLCY